METISIDSIHTKIIIDPYKYNACRSPHPVLVSRFGGSRFYIDWMRDRSKTGLRIYNGATTAMGRVEAWAKRFGQAEIITRQGRLFTINLYRQPGDRYGYYPKQQWGINPDHYNDYMDWPFDSSKWGEPHPNHVEIPTLPPCHEACCVFKSLILDKEHLVC